MSKTIGNMTLKAAPVGTDMVAIADSEDSDKTKKVLLSALSGGGSFEYYHELKNVNMTFNGGDFRTSFITADCDDLTAYTPGIYVLKSPTYNSVSSGYGVNLNINNLGNQVCTVLNGIHDVSYSNPLPSYYFQTDGIYIYVYYNHVFYNIYSPTVGIKQEIYSSTNTTPAINIAEITQVHRCNIFTNPLGSLTLNGNPISMQGFEQEFQFTTGSTFTFTASGLVGKWIGGAPTFDSNKSYVIAIKNGLAAWGEVS